MRKDIPGITITNSFEGLKIEVIADELMQEIWEKSPPYRHFATMEEAEIPEGIFEKDSYNPDFISCYFDNGKQANELISFVVLFNSELTKSENRDVWKMIFTYAYGHNFYAKATLKLNAGGKYVLYKILLSGDASTGLLGNL